MHTTFALFRTCAIAALGLAFGCPSDDTVENGGGSGGATVGPDTITGATQGVTSTSGASTEPSTGSSTDPTAADSTGMPPADACACAIEPPEQASCEVDPLVAWVPGCPQSQPCTRLSIMCPRPGVDLYDCTSELQFDETAMQCMLETLRDGTPARLEIDGDMHYGFSGAQPLYIVHVLEGRTAVQAGCLGMGAITVEPFPPGVHTLADPGYFTDCMAVEAPRERYQCMMDGLGEGTALPACPG